MDRATLTMAMVAMSDPKANAADVGRRLGMTTTNLLIFHTVVGMTRTLDSLVDDGHGAAITPEALAGTSPYLNEHLNRFGSYEPDLSKPPAPAIRAAASASACTPGHNRPWVRM